MTEIPLQTNYLLTLPPHRNSAAGYHIPYLSPKMNAKPNNSNKHNNDWLTDDTITYLRHKNLPANTMPGKRYRTIPLWMQLKLSSHHFRGAKMDTNGIINMSSDKLSPKLLTGMGLPWNVPELKSFVHVQNHTNNFQMRRKFNIKIVQPFFLTMMCNKNQRGKGRVLQMSVAPSSSK